MLVKPGTLQRPRFLFALRSLAGMRIVVVVQPAALHALANLRIRSTEELHNRFEHVFYSLKLGQKFF